MATISPRGQELDEQVAEEMAQKLKDAMVGLGTSEEEIIEVLVSCNNKQRQQIRDKYASFGSDLIEDLKGELGGDFEDAIIGLMTPADEYDARVLHDAVCGPGTCENTIVGILATRDNDEIQVLKEKYKELYDTELIDDLQCDVSGNFAKQCYGIVEGNRNEDSDDEGAEEEAQKLQEKGVDQIGTDEVAFNFVLCNASYGQLRKIMRKYEANTGTSLIDAIDSEFSGDVKEGYLAMLKCARDKPSYFAERLFKAMDGAGTEEGEVMRILISRAEIDLEDIKNCYSQFTDTPLVDHIDSEFSGDLKKCLKSIVCGHYVG